MCIIQHGMNRWEVAGSVMTVWLSWRYLLFQVLRCLFCACSSPCCCLLAWMSRTCLITLGLWPAATRVVQRRLRSADRQQMVVPSYKTTVQSATALLLKSRTYYVSYQYNTCSCQYNSFTYNGLQVLLVKYLYNTIAGQFNTLYSCTIYAMIFYLQIPYYNDFRFYVTGIGLIFQLFVQLQYVSIHYLYYLIYFTYYRFMNQLQIL